jgi:septal ring factor EnvC (AmiA/AmiB activator)
MSTWDDFSTNEKVAWLKARLARIESAVGTLSDQIDEVSKAVKTLEKQQREQRDKK